DPVVLRAIGCKSVRHLSAHELERFGFNAWEDGMIRGKIGLVDPASVEPDAGEWNLGEVEMVASEAVDDVIDLNDAGDTFIGYWLVFAFPEHASAGDRLVLAAEVPV